MFVDCHVHSNFSADGKMSVAEACSRARAIGLRELIFTDHVDFDVDTYPDLSFDPHVRHPAIEEARRASDQNLAVMHGVELGFQSHAAERNRGFLAAYPFDFIILSVHAAERIDFCDPKLHEQCAPAAVCQRYLDAIHESVATDTDFDVVGHIGYALRYLPNAARFREIDGCPERLDRVLKAVVERGKGIEVNTSGYRHAKVGESTPAEYILRRFHELGGKIVTLGSDAHETGHLGFNFAQAAEMLRSAGFGEVAYFVARKPVFVRI
jgi:histidinol-phosphatase (PHP family)